MNFNAGIINRTRLAGVIFLALLFGYQIFNNSVYTHFHRLPDGRIVSHAHPYHKDSDNQDGNSHQHTQPCLLIIACGDILFFEGTENPVFNPDREAHSIYSPGFHFCDQFQTERTKGRSPPLS